MVNSEERQKLKDVNAGPICRIFSGKFCHLKNAPPPKSDHFAYIPQKRLN